MSDCNNPGTGAPTYRGLRNFLESPPGRRISKWTGTLITLGIAAWLIYRLTIIGWDEVWRALPKTPWFYIILAVIFLILPIAQMFIYARIWRIPRAPLFGAMLNKRVFDKEVLGYSGDVYLYLWIRKRFPLSNRRILAGLKDNIILSSLASTAVAVFLLLLFFAGGRIAWPRQWGSPGGIHMVLAGVFLMALGILAYRFRRKILTLDRRTTAVVMGIHLLRLLLVQLLQVVQWHVVMPEVPVIHWATLLALQIVITRIPLIPSRDLVFLGAGIEVAGWIRVSTPGMAGMLLASSVLSKIMNLGMFLLVSWIHRRRRDPENAAIPVELS